MPFPPHRRYRLKTGEPARLHAPDGVVIRLLRDWMNLGEGIPLLPPDGPDGIHSLRSRTRKVLGE